MKNRKEYIECIRSLPEEYVSEKTRIAFCGDDILFIAANPTLEPIKYTRKNKWEKINLEWGEDD